MTMSQFVVPFDDLSTGAVADTFKTMAAVQAADTAGYRCRIRKITVGPAADTPVDRNVAIILQRVDDVSAGGSGTKTAATPTQKDSLSAAAVCAGGVNYTAEPTVYGTDLFAIEMNLRNSLVMEWTPEDAPIVNRDQLIGLLVAPRSANAESVSGCIEFEEF